jgi:hypothetical protein
MGLGVGVEARQLGIGEAYQVWRALRFAKVDEQASSSDALGQGQVCFRVSCRTRGRARCIPGEEMARLLARLAACAQGRGLCL